jgi:hypothetical protein
MSDEMAEKAAQEAKDKEAAQKAAEEELQKRLLVVQLVVDPTTGQFARMPNENVSKQYQLDGILYMALKSELIASVIKAVRAELDQRDESKKGKGLFRGR